MQTIKSRIALGLMLALTVGPAFAGPLSGALNYVESNLVTDIETLAIIGLAIIMFSMQIRWQLVLGICAGIWVLANPDVIRSAISGG